MQLHFTSPNLISSPSYPSNITGRATYFKTLGDTTQTSYLNKNNKMCYTYSKNYYYKPHSDYGMVGRTAAGYLGQRKRL